MHRIRSNIFVIKLRLVIFIFFLIAIFSCSSLKKYERYSGLSYILKPKADEIYLNPSLKKCLESEPYCSMIFSKIISHQHVISKEEEDYYTNYLYSAIINKLVKNNLVVNSKTLNKDRFLLNQASIYDSLNITNEFASDLMIDFVDFRSIEYQTNRVIPDTSKVKKEIIFPKPLYFRGQSLMFKITHILTGEIIGNFIFNYTPCINGCDLIYNKDNSNNINSIYFKRTKSKNKPKIDTDENSKIFEELLSRFISELLKYRNNSDSIETHREYLKVLKTDSLKLSNLNHSNVKLIYHPGYHDMKFESDNGSTYDLTITNLLGEKLFNGIVVDKQLINVSHIPAGLYDLVVKFRDSFFLKIQINIIHY